MSILNNVLTGYEDTKLVSYMEAGESFPNTHYYDELESKSVEGVLKANRYVGGRLMQTYSEKENHVGVIAATRLGKTTSYVIPTILSFAKQMVKRSMVISDPKGELYRTTAATLKKQGYRVRLINFRDYRHSECWNPLTKIYKAYIEAMNVEDGVTVVTTKNGPRNCLDGVIYNSQAKLDDAIARIRKVLIEDVGNDIDNLAAAIISTDKLDDPYWEDSARDLLKAGIWAMLEDSQLKDSKSRITEDTFSFGTLLSIFDGFNDGTGSHYEDDGYFSDRPKNAKSYMYAHKCILENAPVTRKCIVSTFNAKMSVYKNSAIRLITSCNSFKMEELADGTPTVVFIDYRDEIKTHYKVISSFVQDAYNYLIQYSNKQKKGKLDVPFYFILDEFGNFPAIPDFETVISACGGRNIFFILILQSYAQLVNVYKQGVADIIKDNLNLHVFIGSNNPETLTAFSTECGEYARIAPVSAINGASESINYHVETIPRMPKSFLSGLKEGECIVTEANCGYVMFSKMERYYKCSEFSNLPESDEKEYAALISPLDDKYTYVVKKKQKDTDRDW